MEFPFNVNHILPETITLVDERLAPFRGKYKHDRVLSNSKQTELKNIIDIMGDASAKAQGLKTSITSAFKLATSDHRLYILKDAAVNNGLGAVVGIIKIGHKKLFVLDYQGNHNEVNPLCVLDFYVHESRQRTGCGKMLFNHVIKNEEIQPGRLAIDSPSNKFLSFLKKHYNLDKPIPQVNNFVVYAEFFRDLQAVGLVSKRNQRLPGSNLNRPPLYPYKRPVENDHLLQKRRAVSRQSPINQLPSSRQEVTVTSRQATNEPVNQSQAMDIDINTTRSSPDVVMANDTSRNSQTHDEALNAISLPPLGPRPPGRHSASRCQVESAGTRWDLGSSLRSGSNAIPDAFNADRGLAARATSYSRYNTSRESSAPEISRTKRQTARDSGQVDGFERVSSGGRKRNLHLTSAGNPLQVTTTPAKHAENNKSSINNSRSPVDLNANKPSNTTTGVNPNFISPTGNYSISQMYSYYEQKRSLGTGWNVFGVPSGTNYGPGTSLASRRNPSRTFPY